MHKHDLIREELDELYPQRSWVRNCSIAVLLPCYNEAISIGSVIKGFQRALPSARVYVYDNNSTDTTHAEAAKAGAVVRLEPYQGKGNVLRRMLADIDADVYVVADGDATYDPSAAGRLIDALVAKNLDMVIGTRSDEGGAFRRGHQAGNLLFNRVVGHLFGRRFTDILSGYRVLSRRFAKSFPVTSSGFEIETELSIHALDLKIATAEIPLPYLARPDGSTSKLRTYRDGIRILLTILLLYKELRPLRFFGMASICLIFAAVGLATPLLVTYVETGLVPRFPTAILAAAVAQIGFLGIACGLVLESIAQGRREAKHMRYLDLSSIGRDT